MHQIRIHGRGGQGVVTAAELIAIAAFYDGKNAQAFPAFGVERSGAPIESFARIDDKPIRIREQISEPDVLIVQDPTLIGNPVIERGTNKKTIIIINSSKNKKDINFYPAPFDRCVNGAKNVVAKRCGVNLRPANIYLVDATKIALEKIGKNIVNTTILGAFARSTGLISLEALKKAIKEKFKDKGQETIDKNISAIEEAYNTNF